MARTVKAVADLAGVSVRTLHHYDEIGLLKPAQVSAAGYRLYAEADLERLQQVLFFRELGFSLVEIKEILTSPSFDRRQALLQHRRLLLQRQERLKRLIQCVERTLDAIERGISMDEQAMFDGFDASKYGQEAADRWGASRAWSESQLRTRGYAEGDWRVIQEETQEIIQRIADRMDRGPADAEVQEWIARHHQQINDRFYTCTTDIYRGLGDMYVEEERFAANYERIKPGLSAFMRAAVHVFCDARERM